MIKPFVITSNLNRGTLIEVHIADLHFGAANVPPDVEYNILEEQFLNVIDQMYFDIISINGDIFDHKFMSNSDVVLYAMKFVDRVINICKARNATCVIIHGTESHDAKQLKLFYRYLDDPNLDLRIIESIQLIYVKGARILCIPEEYGKGEQYYLNALFNNGEYDSVFMHGTIKGSVYGANKADLNSPKYPVFDINSFALCRGPIIAGHVHDAGCFDTYMYYCSSPIRYKFGEEGDKGFIILLHNLDTQEHYVHFQKIESFRYDTINLDSMINYDPKVIIEYLKNLQASGIDNVKVRFTNIPIETLNILKNYYKNNSSIVIEADNEYDYKKQALKANEDVIEKYKEMDFLLDNRLSEQEKFVRFVNYNEGKEFITVDSLIKLLQDV